MYAFRISLVLFIQHSPFLYFPPLGTHLYTPPWEFSSFWVHFCVSFTFPCYFILHTPLDWGWRSKGKFTTSLQQHTTRVHRLFHWFFLGSVHPSFTPSSPSSSSISPFSCSFSLQPARVHSIWEQFACQEACDLSSKGRKREREEIFLTWEN